MSEPDEQLHGGAMHKQACIVAQLNVNKNCILTVAYQILH